LTQEITHFKKANRERREESSASNPSVCRSVAICSRCSDQGVVGASTRVVFELENVPISAALVDLGDVQFIPDRPDNDEYVLVKTRAFSCNYRDRGLMLQRMRLLDERTLRSADEFFCAGIGSDFVGDVIAIGKNVEQIRVGDRVIPNASFPRTGYDGVRPGVPTNSASCRLHVLHFSQIVKVPPSMPDEAAAGFSIGYQTAYGMVRRLHLRDESNVLVTAAGSNTSLKLLQVLRKHHLNVYALTSKGHRTAELKAAGAKEIFVVPRELQNLWEHAQLTAAYRETEGFDAILDPFSDFYLGRLVEFVATGGAYITCGIKNQFASIAGSQGFAQAKSTSLVLALCIKKNITIMGNCLGTREDLETAISDFESGMIGVQIDSVFTGSELGGFFHRSFGAEDRFGQVVYRYANGISTPPFRKG
jgi:NADPH:quinone reductase-like Zn-dependent oxidoreductase